MWRFLTEQSLIILVILRGTDLFSPVNFAKLYVHFVVIIPKNTEITKTTNKPAKKRIR